MRGLARLYEALGVKMFICTREFVSQRVKLSWGKGSLLYVYANSLQMYVYLYSIQFMLMYDTFIIVYLIGAEIITIITLFTSATRK